ncbi:YmfQ family protein [Rhizobium sp.]|uniref:YmfQ family protein n=1 Tax=Rhizobium sp. TaxID=391 RepID=UPI003F7EF51A
MARSASTILQSIISKLPTGFALGRRGGILDTVFAAVADVLSTVENEADRLVTEADPRAAVDLLPDYERLLGPDPCGRDLDNLTLFQRQRIAHQRWTARGGQSIPYFVGLAASLGAQITVEEFWPSKAGRLRAGQRLRPNGCQFVWRVNIPGLFGIRNFKAGVSRAGQSLGSFDISAVECVLRRPKPAHTEIVFSYQGNSDIPYSFLVGPAGEILTGPTGEYLIVEN